MLHCTEGAGDHDCVPLVLLHLEELGFMVW